MLRSSEKRLHIGERLPYVFGGRGGRVFPKNVKPPRLSGPTVPPVSGYIGWFDAFDASSFTLSDLLVSQWSDKSGNGNHLTQGTAANQPVYGLGQINGCPCVQFDGISDNLASSISGSDRSASFFAVVVFFNPSTASIRGSGGGTGGDELRVDATGHLETLRSGVSSIGVTAATIGAGVATVAGQVLTDTDVTHYINLATETDSDSTTFTSSRTSLIGVNRTGGTSFSRFNIGELVFYDTSLSAGDAQAVVGYLMQKWRIS